MGLVFSLILGVLNLKSNNVYDKKEVVEEFEKIRDVFEDIQTKITLKQAGVHRPS